MDTIEYPTGLYGLKPFLVVEFLMLRVLNSSTMYTNGAVLEETIGIPGCRLLEAVL